MSFHKFPGHLLRAKPKVFFLAFVLSWHLSPRYQDIPPFWKCVNLLWVTLWKTASTVVEPESPGAMAALILSIIGDTKLYQQVKPFLDWTNVFLLPRSPQCHFPEVDIEEIGHVHYYHCNASSEYALETPSCWMWSSRRNLTWVERHFLHVFDLSENQQLSANQHINT